KYPANSFKDLAFLAPMSHKEGDCGPPKFLVFFDDWKDAEAATLYLCSCIAKEHRNKIKNFHSMMSPEYCKVIYKALRANVMWGLCVTDSFGM
ncbi:hypothetical protein OE88DRAFT_1613817, partial [Heliocybe sulcata]